MAATQQRQELVTNSIDKERASAIVVSSEAGGLKIQSVGEVFEVAKMMAVSMQAVQTDVEIARANLAGVQCDPGDRRTVVISSAAVEGGH